MNSEGIARLVEKSAHGSGMFEMWDAFVSTFAAFFATGCGNEHCKWLTDRADGALKRITDAAQKDVSSLYDPVIQAFEENPWQDLLDVRESNGYQFIKVAPRNKKMPRDNWIPLSKFEWMRQNGRDFPDDCVCVFANGDTRDYSKENLVPVPIDVYPIVSSGAHGAAIRWHDRQTLEVAITYAKVIRERRRLQNHDRTCGCCNRTFKPEYPHQRTCRACLDAGLRARRRA